MFVAPHPDDEALAGAVILQRAARAAVPIRVLYATDGDNNPWPHRATKRHWRINGRDRQRWARLRRIEACAALRELGVDRGSAAFLAFPDQGLAALERCARTLDLLRASIVTWQPTLLLVPSVADTHADHRALGMMLQTIEASATTALPPLSIWSYQVHGRLRQIGSAVALAQSAAETARKIAAISRHRTQLLLSRRRFLAYAARPEIFRPVRLRELPRGFSGHAAERLPQPSGDAANGASGESQKCVRWRGG